MIIAYYLLYFSYFKIKKVPNFTLAQSYLRGFYLCLIYSVIVLAFLLVNQTAGKQWYLLVHCSPVGLVCQLGERHFKSLLYVWEHFLENIFCFLVSYSSTLQSGQCPKYIERLVLCKIYYQKTLVPRILYTCPLTILTIKR